VEEHSSARLTFGVLGPLVVSRGSQLLDPGPYKQRVLLGLLLLRTNLVVSVDELVQAVWPEGPPRTARKNLQVYVSTLRKLVGNRIRRVSYGYVFDAVSDELDALKFDSVVAAAYAAHHSGDLPQTRKLLGQAVELWRDDPLADLVHNPVIAAESERISQRYLSVYEDWVDLEIDAGRHLKVIGKLTQLSNRHPFRERLTAASMTALHHAGRRREALATFEAHRQLLARELGLAPSVVLQRLYQTILAGEADGPKRRAPAVERLRPAQLPRDVPDLVGRTELADELVARLSRPGGCDVAVVTGATGTGKTALAIHVGHRLASAFSDGHVFVSLRSADGIPRRTLDVVTELLRATGPDLVTPCDEGHALAVWRSWLADRDFLVILDDATDDHRINELLPGNGRNRTLITSSDRLSGLESVHRAEIGELSFDDAAELLARMIGRARVVETALQRIIDRCGSTPLAIRAVGSKLATMRHVPMADLADRLESMDAVLDELAVRGESLRTRLQRRHADLGAVHQQAVRALGTLPGTAVRHDELAAAFTPLPEPAASVIERLIEANVVGVPEFEVMSHAIDYTIPALVRQFAIDLARGTG